ncbi:carbohydrate ABC transporter permease [Vallitalea guaymasensis]|uniref:carbohydrate ABC transporter permease n=1 Tax=Vallitalea guaymasensis TaxID=1185412 RepID=UPI000DE4CE05|nr:sugar ABC transporter permease [Vallitalea guaymasensis]
MNNPKKRNKLRSIGQYLLYAGPSTFAFFLVMIVPFLYGVFLTTTNWDGLSSNFDIVGLKNYFNVFKDKAFWSSFVITIKYVVCVVFFTNVIAFLFAYILTSGIKLQNLFRAGFFTPNLLGGIVLGFVWQFLFSNVFVYIGKSLHIPILSSSWLGNPNKAFWAMVIVTVWQLSGYLMIIYIAGFTNIPKSVLEAAMIDGASGFKKIYNIIIPLMVNAFTISVFLSLQRAFMVYDLNISLTNGGPFNTTKMVSMYVYNKAFLSQEYGLGQAQAFVLFLVVAIVTILQVKSSKSKEVEA